MAVDLDVDELLIMGDSDLIIRQAPGEWETRDIKLISYRQHGEDLNKGFKSVEFRYIPRFHNEVADALATLASMLLYPGNVHIDLLEIQANGDQKRTIRRLASSFFLSGEVLYKRTPDLNLLSGEQEHQEDPQENGSRFRNLRKMCTSVGATPCLLVYGTEAVIPAEDEIPSLRIIVEAKIEDDEWVKTWLEQLTMIDEKWMAAVCHWQLYQQRIARACNKKVWPRKFEVGQLVLRRILPHHKEAKGKFAPNWKGPYIIRRMFLKGALYLGDIKRNDPETSVNADAVKRYYI
ncbi:uncharacterized protein [Nicotiana tomentosiformis]|uniref:uncharacterized protein n=1 Tax=Nicotiana tomentosiformis TaxID=4098 RepID=UPI00388CC806